MIVEIAIDDDVYTRLFDNGETLYNFDDIEHICTAIRNGTTEPRTGHWVMLSPTDMYCSECHEIEHLDMSRQYCAFCGAKMKEVNNDLT